ncbi:MAG: hypothetical protein HQ478_09440 [Chloroflexi bacterium]|nr:hypothetical protein [Chloroflexota bacterium]
MAEIKARTEGNNEVAEFEDLHPECAHFWMIDAPAGPISKGTCKQCKQVREFQNSIQTSGWDRGNSAARKKAAAAAKKKEDAVTAALAGAAAATAEATDEAGAK